MKQDNSLMLLKSNLKALLKSRGMNVAHLSRESGVAIQTLHNWLSGMEPRSLGHVKKVAVVLKVSVDELCFNSTNRSDTLKQYEDEINCGVFEVVLRKVRSK